MKKIIRRFYYYFAFIFSKIVLVLPYYFSVKIGGMLGWFSYYVLLKSRKIVLDNLMIAFPEKESKALKKIAHKVFINQGKNLFELFSFPKLNKNDIFKISKINDKEPFNKALDLKKGVLIASAHCGNWELMGASLSLSGFPINVIARKIYIEELNGMLISFRNSKGIKVILRSALESAKEILRSIRNNEAIGILLDQDTNVPGVFVDFFSKKAWTPSGLATLAYKTEASVILALDTRLSNDKHEVLLTGPLELIYDKDKDTCIFENTQYITKLIENHIKEYPEQWVWMHQRWKTQQ